MTIAIVILSIILIVACAFFCFAYFPCRKSKNLLEAKYDLMTELTGNIFMPIAMANQADKLPLNILLPYFRDRIIKAFQKMIRDNIEKSDLENLGNFYLRLESLAIKPFLKKSLVDFLKSALGRIDFGELSSLLIKIIFAEIKNDVSANIKDLQATRSLILEALKPNNTTQTKITMAIILDNDLKKLMNESPDLKPDEKIMLDGERVKIQRQLLANN